MIDPQMKYWVSLCEDASSSSNSNDDYNDAINETYEEPYLYDIADAPEILTVGALKKVLANFNDDDRLSIINSGNSDCEIKAIWNSDMENEIVGDNSSANTCFIHID